VPTPTVPPRERRPRSRATCSELRLTEPPADLVVTGATIYRAGDDSASALAVRGDRIVAVGTEDEVRDQVGSTKDLLHLPGRLVLPGFADAHVHPPTAGRNLLTIALDGLTGRAAYLAAIAAYADANPQVEWISGGGWAMEYFSGGLPTSQDLDALVPDRPVFLYNRDLHGAWVNTRALEIAGIDRFTPDPDDGRIERDQDTGEPTGMLHEGAAYHVFDTFVPVPDRAGWEAGILAAQDHLHALGITSWQDAWVTPATQEAYVALAADGRLTAHVVGALWWERTQGLAQIPSLLARREDATARGGSRFRPTTVKIMTDGVLENRTGALLEPYCDGHGGHSGTAGLAFIERDELAAAVTELDNMGFQVHLHAIGDRAVRNCLDAVEAALGANGPSGHRHHVAHLQLIHPQDLPRFAALGVVANCQTYWAQSEPQMDELTLPVLGPDRAGAQYLFGDLLRSGARMAMGSDWPVTTANPLEQIEVAVTRVDPENRDNAPFLPGQRLSLADAVAGFTVGSAHVNHDEAESGSIEVGKRADLAILDRNLFAPGAGPVGEATVEVTVASGRIVHAR
jgi:predicted amidohydrolase YtcJ